MDRDVSYKMKQALTVSQLMEQLERMDPDAKVVFVCDYGDYHHTQQALPVLEVDETDTPTTRTNWLTAKPGRRWSFCDNRPSFPLPYHVNFDTFALPHFPNPRLRCP